MGYDQQLVTSKQFDRTTSYKLTSLEVRERALIIGKGLTSTTEPHDMTAWYCKAFKELGEGRYTAIAKTAREAVCDPTKGHSNKKLFGWLLRQEMSKRKSQSGG